jgi:hypothetical protein
MKLEWQKIRSASMRIRGAVRHQGMTARRNRERRITSFVGVLLTLSLTSSSAISQERRDSATRTSADEAAATPILTGQEATSSPNILRLIGTDFKNVFTTRENYLIVGAGLGAAWGAHQFDDDVASGGLNSELAEDTTLDYINESGQVVGGAFVQVGGAFVLYGVGAALSKPGVEDLGRHLVRAQVVTQSITAVIKAAVGRERPDGSSNRSFPSGHSSGTFATATVLQRSYGWKAGLPAYLVASYVAVSRLNENVHYLSDVVFGAALGIMGGRTVTIDLHEELFVFSPMLKPDAVGIQLTWPGPAR